jgi:hypothetical protein
VTHCHRRQSVISAHGERFRYDDRSRASHIAYRCRPSASPRLRTFSQCSSTGAFSQNRSSRLALDCGHWTPARMAWQLDELVDRSHSNLRHGLFLHIHRNSRREASGWPFSSFYPIDPSGVPTTRAFLESGAAIRTMSPKAAYERKLARRLRTEPVVRRTA